MIEAVRNSLSKVCLGHGLNERYEFANDGALYNQSQYSYGTWNASTGSISTTRTVVTDDSSRVETMEFDNEWKLIRQRITANNTTEYRRYTYYGKELIKDEISYDNNTWVAKKDQRLDEYKNAVLERNDLGQMVASFYDTSRFNLLVEKREKVSEQPQDSTTDGVWNRSVYNLTNDGKAVASESHVVAKKQFGSSSPRIITGPSSEGIYGEWRWTPPDEVKQVNLDIFWFAAAPFQCTTYQVYYREVGSKDWTYYGGEGPKCGGWTSVSGTTRYQIPFPATDWWEVRVLTTLSGTFGTRPEVLSSSAVHDIMWQPTTAGQPVRTDYEYYSSGAMAGLPSKIKVALTFDTSGNPMQWQETNIGYETRFNAYPNNITVPNGSGISATTSASYDYLGRTESITDTETVNGTSTSFTKYFTYDNLGRLLTMKQPDVKGLSGTKSYTTTQWVYSDSEPSVTVIVRDTSDTAGANPYDKTKLIFDALGRKKQEQKVVGGQLTTVHSWDYNQLGLVKQERVKGDAADVVTSYTYDARGRLRKTIFSDDFSSPNFEQTVYTDGLEQTRTITDANKHTTIQKYDLAGRLVSVEQSVTETSEPVTYTTRYTYDLLGRMLSVKDPKDQITTYEYGTNGWLRTITMPGSHFPRQEFTYDGAGNRISANYGTGVITYTYDKLNRVTQINYPATEATAAQTVIIAYEKTQGTPNGEKRTATVKEGSKVVNQVESMFDPMGRLVSENWTGIDNPLVNHVLRYEYDGAGNLKSLTYPDNYTVTYTYHAGSNRLSGIPGYINSFRYATNGFLTGINFGNGAATTITPDQRYRPQQILTTLNGQTLFDAQYTYDLKGNVICIKDAAHPDGLTQTYDEIDRLRVARTPINGGSYEVEYGYDGAGNRTSETSGSVTRTFTYNSSLLGNAVESVTTGDDSRKETFTYYTDGAIKTRTKGDVTTEYLYDGAGRLVQVKRNDQTIATYVYDGYGRLVKTTESLPTTKTTIRLPMGNETAYEEIVEGGITIKRKYIVGNGRYLAKVERVDGGAEQISYYHNDHLGSTRTVSSADVATMTYDAYGKLIQSTGAVDEHNHRYTGKSVDATGLYYYGTRFYDPELGRFITVDPARDGLNWYEYGYSNPLRYVDPDGQVPWDTVLDAGYLLWDVYRAVTGHKGAWAEVAMDAAGMVVPYVSAGMLKGAVKVANAADNIADIAKTAKGTSKAAAALKVDNLYSIATKAGKGGVTPVGRAFQKHAGDAKRAGTFVGEVSGNAAKNTQQGAAYLMEILTNPESTFAVRNTKAFGDVLDVRLPDGMGARWSADGETFIGFLERYTP